MQLLSKAEIKTIQYIYDKHRATELKYFLYLNIIFKFVGKHSCKHLRNELETSPSCKSLKLLLF